MALVLKRQRLRLAGMQAQSRLPAQNMDLEPLQTLTVVSQGLAGAQAWCIIFCSKYLLVYTKAQ